MGSFIHCPSCGAPAEGQFCEYCGTPLFTAGDVVNDMQGRRCHIWFELDNGKIEAVDVFAHSVTIDEERVTYYADGRPYRMSTSAVNLEINAQLTEWKPEDWKKLVEWQKVRMKGER